MDIKIAIAYHKPSIILDCEHFLPIHAGKALSKYDLGIQGDDKGDNISMKNPWYCELTALYWLWKNTTADYKGLMHYRRIFTCRNSFPLHRLLMRLKYKQRQVCSLWTPYRSMGVKKQYSCDNETLYKKHAKKFSVEIQNILKDDVCVIAPHPGHFYISIRQFMYQHLGGQNITLLEEITKENFPDFFPFLKQSLDNRWFYNCNMSVMKNSIFEDYCNILVSLLRLHEEESISRGILNDLTKEKAYLRISGYLGEVITNAYIQYCLKTGKKVKVLPVVFLK